MQPGWVRKCLFRLPVHFLHEGFFGFPSSLIKSGNFCCAAFLVFFIQLESFFFPGMCVVAVLQRCCQSVS